MAARAPPPIPGRAPARQSPGIPSPTNTPFRGSQSLTRAPRNPAPPPSTGGSVINRPNSQPPQNINNNHSQTQSVIVRNAPPMEPKTAGRRPVTYNEKVQQESPNNVPSAGRRPMNKDQNQAAEKPQTEAVNLSASMRPIRAGGAPTNQQGTRMGPKHFRERSQLIASPPNLAMFNDEAFQANDSHQDPPSTQKPSPRDPTSSAPGFRKPSPRDAVVASGNLHDSTPSLKQSPRDSASSEAGNTQQDSPTESQTGWQTGDSDKGSRNRTITLGKSGTQPKDPKMMTKRRNIVEEILVTERDYVKDLDTLINQFYTPMQQLMSAEDMGAVFYNIAAILGLHKEVLTELQNTINLSDPDTWVFGGVFNKFALYMKLYTTYCSNQENSGLIVEKARKKSKSLDAFLKETEFTEAVNNLSLASYLIKPVQRICKYPLLLKTLMADTDDDHPDKLELEGAMKKMDDVLGHLNEMKRRSERTQRLVEIHKRITACEVDLIKPHRKFIREGELVKISKGKAQARHFFLFNDLLLYTKPAGSVRDNYVFKGYIQLDKCLCTCVQDTAKEKNAFKLIRVDDKKKNYVICASTPAQRDEWANDVMKCIDVILSKLMEESKGEFAKDGFLSVGGKAKKGTEHDTLHSSGSLIHTPEGNSTEVTPAASPLASPNNTMSPVHTRQPLKPPGAIPVGSGGGDPNAVLRRQNSSMNHEPMPIPSREGLKHSISVQHLNVRTPESSVIRGRPPPVAPSVHANSNQNNPGSNSNTHNNTPNTNTPASGNNLTEEQKDKKIAELTKENMELKATVKRLEEELAKFNQG
eukprot:TRINITY_DN5753_c0_g1_i1.p1 TRINITY_DN5753_c0_g1~~TRINITY_DN5753_c0_g1_i1.p1  ORF type:complete len:810 (-),score=147.38 TRINITY_DN5753_c0_g1_i1:3-2432(-)